MKTLLGKKVGMTRVFDESGVFTPVTVIEVGPCSVLQLKTVETDGYNAVQLGYDARREQRTNNPLKGQLKKAKVGLEFAKVRQEVRCSEEDLAEVELGKVLTAEMFNDINFVDVIGTSKGKGFAGVIKRYNFKMQDATHGNSLAHRAPGSIGQCQTPGRVFKGKKMAGHMGNVKKTIQSLKVVKVDAEKGLLLVKGAIPGTNKGLVTVRKAIKKN